MCLFKMTLVMNEDCTFNVCVWGVEVFWGGGMDEQEEQEGEEEEEWRSQNPP